ncbi:hypothetical protein V8C44DRAFT_112724 [Trichoderma aethiopicum]
MSLSPAVEAAFPRDEGAGRLCLKGTILILLRRYSGSIWACCDFYLGHFLLLEICIYGLFLFLKTLPWEGVEVDGNRSRHVGSVQGDEWVKCINRYRAMASKDPCGRRERKGMEERRKGRGELIFFLFLCRGFTFCSLSLVFSFLYILYILSFFFSFLTC